MSVYKRGAKGVFYMNFTVNGKRVFKSTGKYTKKEAKQIEANERQKLLNDEKMTPQERAARTLMSEAIEQVYQARWKKNKDGDNAKRNASRFIALIGDLPIGNINDEVVYDYIAKLEATEISTATVNRYLAALKTLLRFKRQTWDYIKLRKETKGRIRVISKKEEETILNLIRGVKLNIMNQFYLETADLIEVLVDSGFRLSEAINLKYEDINFTTNLMSIWVNKGVDLYVVKEFLGHSTIQVTERYAHLSPDKLAHAAEILDEY